VKAGDLIFYRSTSWIGDIVCYITQSEFSHVALAVDSKHVIEANRFIKTRKVPLEETATNIVVMRPTLMTEEQSIAVVKLAETLLGRPYDYKNSLWWGVRLIYKLITQADLPSLYNDLNSLYCSELIDHVYTETGVDLVIDREVCDVTPENLYKSPLLYEVPTI
jgi:uncharacterized protein YycO